jgi:hypothetical protein
MISTAISPFQSPSTPLSQSNRYSIENLAELVSAQLASRLQFCDHPRIPKSEMKREIADDERQTKTE